MEIKDFESIINTTNIKLQTVYNNYKFILEKTLNTECEWDKGYYKLSIKDYNNAKLTLQDIEVILKVLKESLNIEEFRNKILQWSDYSKATVDLFLKSSNPKEYFDPNYKKTDITLIREYLKNKEQLKEILHKIHDQYIPNKIKK